MDTREQYTEAEWRILMFAPLWVFCGVANADQAVDESEMAALAQEVEDAEEYDEPLVRDVFRSLREEDGLLQAYQADDRDMDAGLAAAADLLARKAEPSHAEAFKKALLFVGRRVAQAGTGAPFRSQRVSGEEELTLFRVADILGVSLD
jgi:hypothetical protein